ncbi:MAG TPA: hypothetical protein V6C76_05565 [Drouetiella sp.]
MSRKGFVGASIYIKNPTNPEQNLGKLEDLNAGDGCKPAADNSE